MADSNLTCMWCDSTGLVYKPIPTGYYEHSPDGDEFAIYEEGYLCLPCGEHCDMEEVYYPEADDD